MPPASPTLPPDPLTGPSRLGPFRLVRPISQGGMARVYEGRLDSLHGVSTRVAVKVIHPDFALEPGFQELFVAEARISARLEHQNLVRIQQFNREGNLLYLVMEYIDGITFRKLISLARKHGLAYPPEVIAELGRQVCEGLHYAHMATMEAGDPLHLVHRDIKPSNLMLNAQGVVKVLDFGISYAHPEHVGGEVEQRGAVKGTWGYMSPEQAEGEQVGPAADLFGLGAVLFELAARDPLFEERDNVEIRRLLTADEAARRAAALSGPYSDIASVLVRSLQRDPAARYSSAASMGRALGAMVGDPLRASEGLVALHRELLRLDGAQPADRARSVSTVTRRQPSSPSRTVHPSKGTRSSSTARGVIAAGSVFAVALLGLSFVVLGYTTWRLWDTRASKAEEPTALAPTEAKPPVEAKPTEPAVPADATPPEATAQPEAETPPPVANEPKAEKPKAEKPKTEPKSESKPEPKATVKTEPKAEPPKTPTAEPEAPVRVAAATGQGTLTIGADVRAQVIVDGQYVQRTPMMKKFSAGKHTVKLVTDDGRSKTFSVDVVSGGAVQKVWLFEDGRWGP